MKWLPPNGSTQGSVCGHYVIVQANSKDWISYDITANTNAVALGRSDTDADARVMCETAEKQLMAAMRKRA